MATELDSDLEFFSEKQLVGNMWSNDLALMWGNIFAYLSNFTYVKIQNSAFM